MENWKIPTYYIPGLQLVVYESLVHYHHRPGSAGNCGLGNRGVGPDVVFD